MIRTVSKAFSCGGDEKSGIFGPFNIFCKPFLKEKKLKSLPLERFRGNRFNILFSNAAAVYFLLPKIEEFLKGNDTNRLLKSVKFDISQQEFVAGCKALGLVAYFITIPLWCTIEDKGVHILDASIYYQELINYLETVSNEIDNFMLGNLTLSFHLDDQSDPIFQSLLEPSKYDTLCSAVLKVLIPGICKTAKYLFSDYIKDGKWENLRGNQDMVDKTVSVPKHNKFSETMFGHLDRVLREKPNITLIAAEASLMFVHNKTIMWLQSKTEDEKVVVLGQARKDVKQARKKFKERLSEIEQKRRQAIQEKMQKAEDLERARLSKLQGYTNSILEWGLWQSETEVDFHMNNVCKTNADKLKAVKAQLNFRHFVLSQNPKGDEFKDVYTFSCKDGNKRKNLTAEELAIKVKTLIRHGFSLPEKKDEDEDLPILVGKSIKMYFEGKTGTVKDTWIGHVISTVPGYPNWFNVKFETDPAIYTYQLLEDYRRGDIQIIV